LIIIKITSKLFSIYEKINLSITMRMGKVEVNSCKSAESLDGKV